MAYYYGPQHVTDVTISVEIKLSGGGTRNETVRFSAARDGTELTGQLADTVVSAMHLACAGRSSNDAAGGQS